MFFPALTLPALPFRSVSLTLSLFLFHCHRTRSAIHDHIIKDAAIQRSPARILLLSRRRVEAKETESATVHETTLRRFNVQRTRVSRRASPYGRPPPLLTDKCYAAERVQSSVIKRPFAIIEANWRRESLLSESPSDRYSTLREIDRALAARQL